MCRPSSIAPTTLDLVRMVCTIVEVITHAIIGEGTAAALRHGLLLPSIVGGGMQRLPRIVRTLSALTRRVHLSTVYTYQPYSPLETP